MPEGDYAISSLGRGTAVWLCTTMIIITDTDFAVLDANLLAKLTHDE